MPGKRRQFSREFKEEAVRLVAESGRPVTHVARELALRPEQLREWRHQFGKNGPAAPPGSEAEELRRLRRELEVTRQERDFLKKRRRSSRKSPGEVRLHRAAPGRIPRFA